MDNRKHAITPFGWEIKRKLVEIQIDQKTFCETYQIPPSRLSNLIHGTRKANRYRKQVSSLLGITDELNKPLIKHNIF
ncbi:XRE family transcriptional regulator [Paenibacillus terrae]|uniref:Rha family transcriptional regulator n=1 Tax=Paenibacillus terrae TaxID=159743 RepID=A0A0D7WV98_9BACL|nr:XRE family transcriptional regulator [Paenibacillus terrae]KJD42643.1 Rha family transcriptional regulator [Paenibacillus terrae]